MSENFDQSQKEILTTENIKCDLVKSNGKKNTKKFVIIAGAFFVLAVILAVLAIDKSANNRLECALWFLSASSLTVTFSCVITIVASYVRSNQPLVIVDKLVSISTRDKNFMGVKVFPKYVFTFEEHGEFVLDAQKYVDDIYLWSKTNKMPAEKLFNESEAGDEFYLVISKWDYEKPIWVYNKKHFEMQED